MFEIVSVTLPYFALIACGFVARATGIMGEGSPRILNDFVLYFALPALLIRTLGGVPFAEILRPGFLAAWGVVSFGMFAAVFVASAVLFRQPAPAAAIHSMAAAHGNVGYLGITLVIVLMGEAATAPVAMAMMFDMMVIVPLSIVMLELLRGEGGARGVVRALRAAVLNPFMLAIGGGLALSFSGLTLPGPADSFLQTLGQAAVPAALFAIGVTLYGQPLRGAGMEIGALCAAKLLLHPLAVIFVATSEIFALSREEIVAAVLLSALPVANNVFVVATRYDMRPGRISTVIFGTTLLALGSFNLWAWLLIS